MRCADLDARVWAQLQVELERPSLLQAMAEGQRELAGDAHDWEGDAAGYRAHLQRLERVEAAVMARLRNGLLSLGATDIELAAIGRERGMVRRQLEAAERALARAKSSRRRLGVARSLLEELRAGIAIATPAERRVILRELAVDGGVFIADGRAQLELRLVRPAAAASHDANNDGGLRVLPGDHADSRTICEANVLFRVVA